MNFLSADCRVDAGRFRPHHKNCLADGRLTTSQQRRRIGLSVKRRNSNAGVAVHAMEWRQQAALFHGTMSAIDCLLFQITIGPVPGTTAVRFDRLRDASLVTQGGRWPFYRSTYIRRLVSLPAACQFLITITLVHCRLRRVSRMGGVPIKGDRSYTDISISP